jgi:site-specific DNA recombinase
MSAEVGAGFVREGRNTAPVTLRAAVYCRVSTQEQGDHGYSLDGQSAECHSLAGQLGGAVVLERREVGSGADWDLPGLLDILERAKNREFDLLLCYATSRLARELGKLLVVERELKRCGVTVRYVTQTHDDTPQGRLTRNVFGAFDEFERENIALRFALGKRAKAAQGLVVGTGSPPYGYRFVRDQLKGRPVGLEVDPVTGPVARRIILDLATTSLHQLSDRLAAEGIPTPGGAPRWPRPTLGSLVKNEVYVGEYRYGRCTMVKGRGKRSIKKWRDCRDEPFIPVPALVSRTEWDAAREAIERRRKHKAARRSRTDDPFTLRGLLTCGHCDGAISCTTHPKRPGRSYLCLRRQPWYARLIGRKPCTAPSVAASALEAYAWELVSATLLSPDYLRAGLAEARAAHSAAERQRERLDTLRSEIEKRRKRLGRATMERLDLDAGTESDRALQAASKTIEGEINSLRAQLSSLETQPLPGLSDADAGAIEQFAAEIRAGISVATPVEQRKVFELLRLRGRVSEDPANGVKLGRLHRFSIVWEAVIPVTDDDRRFW